MIIRKKWYVFLLRHQYRIGLLGFLGHCAVSLKEVENKVQDVEDNFFIFASVSANHHYF